VILKFKKCGAPGNQNENNFALPNLRKAPTSTKLVSMPATAHKRDGAMSHTIVPDPHALLTRDQAAAALTAAGFPVKAKTLATKATRGGGPPFQRFGPRPLYKWADALQWAQSRLSPPIGSTSELDAA
jgi:hypothetical protein